MVSAEAAAMVIATQPVFSFCRSGLMGFVLDVEGSCEDLRKVGGFTFAPVVKENVAGRFVGHVVMDRNDVDAAFAQRFEDGLKLVFEHGEIAVDDGTGVCASKSRPSVDAHFLPDFAAA